MEIGAEEKNISSEVSGAPKEEKEETLFDFLKFALIATLIVAPIRFFIAQPFVVSGASMVPSFDTGHYLIIDEVSYRFEDPKRGEVIVFRFPLDPDKFLIKRVVGLPGDTVEIRNETIIIKNELEPDGFVFEQGTILSSSRSANQKITLKEGQYFVLGDNRDESADSRLWGALDREFIIGRPVVRLLPLSKIELFPGSWEQSAEKNE